MPIGTHTVALDDFCFDVIYSFTQRRGNHIDPPEAHLEILEVIPDPAIRIGTETLIEMAGGEDAVYKSICDSLGLRA
jgi:hypothetical protein